MNTVSFAIRTECPPGACVCQRDELLQTPGADLRILQLTSAQEKVLVNRLENLSSLADLRHMQQRMEQQLGIRIAIAPGPREVRTVRGLTVLVLEQPGLCRKTRQSIPAAIRRSMDRCPEIAWALLDETGLFAEPGEAAAD
jgi:hypothetical protein